MFLGTPHRLEGVNDHHFGKRVVSILKLEDVAGSISRQGLSRLAETSATLDGLATRFNRTNLRVDTLSIYEQKLTRTRETGALRSKVKRLIVREPSSWWENHLTAQADQYVRLLTRACAQLLLVPSNALG